MPDVVEENNKNEQHMCVETNERVGNEKRKKRNGDGGDKEEGIRPKGRATHKLVHTVIVVIFLSLFRGVGVSQKIFVKKVKRD